MDEKNTPARKSTKMTKAARQFFKKMIEVLEKKRILYKV